MRDWVIGGRYKLEQEIARGGMGSVWKAFDTQLRRDVAVKLMAADTLASETMRARFEREAQAVARLKSPHVVSVHDYGVENELPYFVMELLEGEDLDVRLKRQGRIPLPACASILSQVAKALASAQAAGIVHRDLKPANIFLGTVDGEELVKVLDFGVASLRVDERSDDHRTGAGTLLGTPMYMSPEQARGRPTDHRSDLWSLAVVAFRALTGAFPYEEGSLGNLIVTICTDRPRKPSAVAPDLGPEVDAFFARALSIDPDKRFQSARELAAALAVLAAGADVARATRVLVVDDEVDVESLIRQRFRRQIRSKVFDFVFAHDGTEAMEILAASPDIEVALADINMPGMDGLTFLARSREVHPRVKVVMVSAYGDMQNIRAAMNRGAFDFLQKPVDFDDLERTLHKTIEEVQETRRLERSRKENGLLRMFVSSGVVEDVLTHGDLGIRSETLAATVAFIDVHGFGKLVEGAPFDEAVRLLNANFEIIVPEVIARQGVVDKFVGDAVMAVFRGEGHLERAAEAALAVRDQLRVMADRAGPTSPYACGVTVGIASGDVVAASIGSRLVPRLDYTVLGDVVKRAAELSRLASRGEIAIDGPAAERLLERFDLRPIQAIGGGGASDLVAHRDPTPQIEVPTARIELG